MYIDMIIQYCGGGAAEENEDDEKDEKDDEKAEKAEMPLRKGTEKVKYMLLLSEVYHPKRKRTRPPVENYCKHQTACSCPNRGMVSQQILAAFDCQDSHKKAITTLTNIQHLLRTPPGNMPIFHAISYPLRTLSCPPERNMNK